MDKTFRADLSNLRVNSMSSNCRGHAKTILTIFCSFVSPSMDLVQPKIGQKSDKKWTRIGQNWTKIGQKLPFE